MDKKFTCEVCGEKDFHLNDGYFYCKECGTQLKQMKNIEIEDEFTENKQYARIIKLKIPQANKPELTTWECYNYLLHGLVEQLIQLGAKEELKVTTLQLWAAYLRSSEVAFFSRHHEKLPKLGINFSQNDAKILYNRKLQRKKRRKSRANLNATNSRAWARQKRALDVSEYEKLGLSETELSQSSTGTNRAIKIEFTNRARKFLKRKIPSSHLKQHENDELNTLDCHSLKFNTSEIPKKLQAEKLDLKTLYTIVYIALNFIEDDIQLSDILRYVEEGHLAYMNVSDFFPENVLENCLKVFRSTCSNQKNILSNDCIRRHTAFLCNRLHLPCLTTPNISNLVVRYVADLNLPEYFEKYIENLINLRPPEMKLTHKGFQSRSYEARAMAYIVFALKLFFGLDGKKETLISKSAKQINYDLKFLGGNHQQLFVWDEWVQYIEMRKIILCQCHMPTSCQFDEVYNDCQNINILEECQPDETIEVKRMKVLNMEQVFKTFQMNYNKPIKNEQCETIKFPPTMTPSRTYFQKVLQEEHANIYIPPFMYEEHNNYDIQSFLNPSNLKQKLSLNGLHITVEKLPTEKDNVEFSLFRNLKTMSELASEDKTQMRNIDFDITDDDWQEYIDQQREDNEFLSSNIIVNLKKLKVAKKPLAFDNENELKFQSQIHLIKQENISDDFSEETNENTNGNDCLESPFDKHLTMYISNLDYWMFLGRPDQLNSLQKENFKHFLPSTFLWLLEMCSKMVRINWDLLYQELLAIEVCFICTLEPNDNLLYQNKHICNEYQTMIKYFKSMW